MLREFGSSIAGAVTVADPDAAKETEPRYEPISESEIIRRLRRAASEGDLGSDDRSRSMLAGNQPKLLLARFGGQWYCPAGARIRLTFSSRGCPDGPTGSPGSITGTRSPRNSG